MVRLVKIFNYGNCKRDFTYVDDIVEGIVPCDEESTRKRKMVGWFADSAVCSLQHRQ